MGRTMFSVWRASAASKPCTHLQQFALVRVWWFDVSFGQFINLPPQVSVLLPDFLQLGLSLRGRAARLEPQSADDGLLRTLGCHGVPEVSCTPVKENKTDEIHSAIQLRFVFGKSIIKRVDGGHTSLFKCPSKTLTITHKSRQSYYKTQHDMSTAATRSKCLELIGTLGYKWMCTVWADVMIKCRRLKGIESFYLRESVQ